MTAAVSVCKCCGAPAAPFNTFDLSRSCEDKEKPVFPIAGIGVPYFRCSGCGFTFTNFFDHWSKEEWAENIYNADYILADPEFAGKRPQYIATQLAQVLPRSWHVLDYGAGNGGLVQEMAKLGFTSMQAFDPYFLEGKSPSRRFDLVTAFEVVEHAPDPIASFRNAMSFVAPGGALFFSTTIQNRLPDRNWSYIAPRNGHISIHSFWSLQKAADALGLRCLTLTDSSHLLYSSTSSPVADHLSRRQRDGALYAASRQGLRALLRSARQFDDLGIPKDRKDARHLARAAWRTLT